MATTNIILCSCSWGNGGQEDATSEERESMLEKGAMVKEVTKADVVRAAESVLQAQSAAAFQKPVSPEKAFFQQVCDSLDLFKGLLVVFMIWAHVDLAIVQPAETFYSTIGHFVGNVAPAACFLGFMLSYGFTCDFAYLTDFKKRSLGEQITRMMRSACLPIVGAWICNICWAMFFFKFPIESAYVTSAFTFYNVYGNGPDFILSFSLSLLIAFASKDVLNKYLESPKLWQRVACIITMLCGPLCLCFYYIPVCQGNKKYLMFLFECDVRDAFTNNLPALPHLFYFYIGVLLSRYVRSNHIFTLTRKQIAGWLVGIGAVLWIAAIPLYSTWWSSWGNLMIKTDYGWVTRGFQKGPSLLWLLGNLFALYAFFLVCMALQELGKHWWPVNSFNKFWEHFGANVLMYLIMSDICIAGMFRNQFPLTAWQGGIVTAMIMLGTRFMHYLGHSSRK